MNILVTGATGSIGRLAVPKLVAAGHAVTATGRSPARLAALREGGATAVQLNLFDVSAVAHAMKGHEAVVNLATSIPPGFSAFLPGAWRETNRLRSHASHILAHAALECGVDHFIQESFAPAYPNRGADWITEGTKLEPARFARGLLEAEASAGRFARGGGAGIVLRFGLLYGPRDPFTRQLLDSVRRGLFPVFGSPDGYLSMVTHEDAASAVLAALRVDSGAYNVVDDIPMTRRASAVHLAALLGAAPPKFLPVWAARLAGSLGESISRSVRVSNQKLRDTGWSPRFASLADGLRAV